MTKDKDKTPQNGDASTESPEDIFGRYEGGDEVDEELLSLSPPPPSLRLLVFVIVILVMSCVMFVWFFPEARYLAQALRDPVDLGEAADIDVGKLTPDTYAKVTGLPLIQRTLTFKEGVKWFMMSDNTRKFFPLAGQPNLYVQWAVTDEHKAYRDPETNPGVMGPPSEFRGHLVTRDQMGPNFERVWLFYDCLRHHFIGRCNYCLGRNTMDECRDAFTCRENNDAEQCGEILARSEGPLEQEIVSLEKGSGSAKNQARLQKLKEIRAALREHRIAIASVKLEEIASETAHLQRLAAKWKSPELETLNKIRAQALKLQVDELTLRAANARRTLDAFDPQKRRALAKDVSTLAQLQKEKETQLETLRTLRAFIQVGDEVEKLIRRSGVLKNKVALLDVAQMTALGGWNPETRDGNELLKAVGDLEEAVAAVERKQRQEAQLAPSGNPPQDAGVPPSKPESPEAKADEKNPEAASSPEMKTTEASADRNGEEKAAEVDAAKQAREAATKAEAEMLAAAVAKMEDKPEFQSLQAKLNTLIERAVALENKLEALTPGKVPELEKWAKTPDVQGAIPEAVRDTAFVGAISKMERMLEGVAPAGIQSPRSSPPPHGDPAEKSDAPQTLADQMDKGIDRLDALKKQIQDLETRPGVLETRTIQSLEALKGSLRETATIEEAGQIVAEISEMVQIMTKNGFYLTKLKSAPQEMARFEKLLTPEALGGLQQQLDKVSPHIENRDWVLIDGEIPLDKLWVLLVYTVLSIMVVVNLRKLWRFWLAFKN